MNIGDIFSIHNLLLLCALFFNINIYIEDMKIISGGVSYSLLSMGGLKTKSSLYLA